MDNLTGSSYGWHKLVEGYPSYEGEGSFPLPAYSEFMPPPRLGITPIGALEPGLLAENDPYGWRVSEMEEIYQLRPGLEAIGRQVMGHLIKLGLGLAEYHIAGHGRQNLESNPYWPPNLAAKAGQLKHEHYVSILPLALSRTQDDKGRVLWTLFGSSEQGPERAFWKSFYTAPGHESPPDEGIAFFKRILAGAYDINVDRPGGLADAGFRILATNMPGEDEEDRPSWARALQIDDGSSFDGISYLLTFRPFSRLPPSVQERYLTGRLHLLPFPGSLALWGMPTYRRLQVELPLAAQIPLLRLVGRHNGPNGIRIPQTGWLHEPSPDFDASKVQPELLVHSFVRTHRWDRIHRFENELSHENPRVERVTKVLFSTDLEVLGLYDKPMARNCQLWTHEFRLLLDGPAGTKKEIHRAEAALSQGGLFGYRFQYPPMRVGGYEVYWHRPLVAYLSATSNAVELLPDAPLGYLTAYPAGAADLSHPVELWPRLNCRPEIISALLDFESTHDLYAHQTALNLVSLFKSWEQLGKHPLPRPFARRMLRALKEESIEDWIASLGQKTTRPRSARRMQSALAGVLQPPQQTQVLAKDLTFAQTATRDFEAGYWNDIKFMSHGDYLTKNNADVVHDSPTQAQLERRHRDLDQLGDYLIERHRAAIRRAGLEGQAQCGELPFHWRTDFNFPLFGGWQSNQEGQARERDILVLIPGKDRDHPVILADHYDTAYEEDLFDRGRGGTGARQAAAGADDNYSASAVLLQSAPIYLNLARQGKLARDIWLLHLTGEEFPADCLGARAFSQALVERALKLHLEGGQWVDLSAAQPVGVFIMDMIAHNRDDNRDTFQISPGENPKSLELAMQAHLANQAWNAATYRWNHAPDREGKGPGHRSQDGSTIPEIAPFLRLAGEVRTRYNPESSLYNTDGQIFSDVGLPVVLFMENYDINRSGYHDTHDTLANIDLDFGAALAAIAIETVARLATRPS